MTLSETDKKNRSVCFTGHRNIPKSDYAGISALLAEKLRILYRHGYTNYYTGGALGFDMIAAVTLINLKRELPDITLELALPCRNHDINWPEPQRAMIKKIIECSEAVTYVSEEYSNGCMQRRNRYMADRSSICIAYLKRNTGGTAYTVKYADSIGCRVLNIASEHNCNC